MKNKNSIWKKDSWRGLPIRQQPNYKDQTHLKKIEEKPQKKLLANVGMYVLNPEVNKYIKTTKILGMDELIKRLLKLRKKICIFPIKEDEWIDTGNWNNYFEAIKKQ